MRAARRLSILATTGLISLLGAAAGASAAGASTSMTQIANLFWIVAILAVGIGVFVGIVLVATVLKFRVRRGHTAPNPKLASSNHTLEAAWTIVPAVILLVLGVLAFETLTFTDTVPQHYDVQVTAIGHQWFWEFWVNYTGNGTDIHYPVGALTLISNQTVLLVVKSVDVDHSLFIPALGVHLDAIPGHVNQIWFKPDMPGQYVVVCTQFCGQGHYAMDATLTVVR
ncbi:MAG TPA: cytochrome c oxidase subunit II transmembrane domain-containing protein [Thermoplasmata archaeon]|nr:cytochrome c oxidase subunit II transmembrane domain-containing protein [Thermoplasmata archaeon]